MGPLFKEFVRSQGIEFSVTLDEYITRLFIKLPQQEISWTTCIEPFHGSVLLSLIFLIIVVNAYFYISYYVGHEKFLNDNSFIFFKTPFIVWGAKDHL